VTTPGSAEQWRRTDAAGLAAIAVDPASCEDPRTIVVDIADAAAAKVLNTADVRSLLAARPAVAIAVLGINAPPGSGDAFDVVIRDGERARARTEVAGRTALDAVLNGISASPLASAALVLLLRGGERRDIDAGLIAESTTYSMLQAGPEFQSWRARTPVRADRSEPGEPLRLVRDGDAVSIVLQRPHVHNAVNQSMRDALARAFDVARLDDSIASVHLHGDGPSFCSGGDLNEFGSFPDPATAHRSRLARSPARGAAAIADRLTVHLHGSCLGAGIEVPAFAHRVVAQAETRLGLPEVRYGLVPGAGGTVSVPRRIGRHRTAWLGLSGQTIGASRAMEWGLVDAMIDAVVS
jgi:enoyl-CoA hydratase/carnithine racemase